MKNLKNMTTSEIALLVAEYNSDAKLLTDIQHRLADRPRLVAGLFATAGYSVRCKFNSVNTVKGLQSALTHQYWEHVLSRTYFYDWANYTNGVRNVSDRETLIAPYLLANQTKGFERYKGRDESLLDFTCENVESFIKEWTTPTKERLNIFIYAFLNRCGASYKVDVSEFKTKLTYRLGDSAWERASDILNLLCAIEFLAGNDFTHLYADGGALELSSKNYHEWLDGRVTLERHANGNSTVRINKDDVARLNAFIKSFGV